MWVGLLGLGFVALGGALLAFGGAARAVPSTEEIMQVCWRTMSRAIGSVSAALPEVSLGPLVSAFLLGSFGFAGWRGVSLWAKTRNLVRSAKCLSPAHPAAAFLRTVVNAHPSLGGMDIHIVELEEPIAFTAGVFHPRIFISMKLIQGLSREELLSVLFHEASHVRRRDPLRWLTVDLLTHGLWFLPVSWSFKRGFLQISERVADDHAVAAGASPLDLASALLKVAGARSSTAIPVPSSFRGEASLSRRIERLLGREDNRERTSTTGRRVWASVAIGLALIAISQLTVPVGGFAQEGRDALASFGRVTQPCMVRMSAKIS